MWTGNSVERRNSFEMQRFTGSLSISERNYISQAYSTNTRYRVNLLMLLVLPFSVVLSKLVL